MEEYMALSPETPRPVSHVCPSFFFLFTKYQDALAHVQRRDLLLLQTSTPHNENEKTTCHVVKHTPKLRERPSMFWKDRKDREKS